MKKTAKRMLMKWGCFGTAAVVGIWLGLAALLVSAPQLDEELPAQTPETTVQTQPTQPPETQPEEVPLPWNLMLVNPWNTIPQDFTVELTELENGHNMDARVCADLQAMLAAMRAEKLKPLICSSFRTYEKQQTLYRNKVNYYLEKDYALPEADAEAGKWVAVPGTSEHQTGLAADIVDTAYPYLDEKQENTAVQKWLMAHSWEYGFILRYPSDKCDITGIYYEPWHYRYVGKEAAKEIFEQGMCLEEYLESIDR